LDSQATEPELLGRLAAEWRQRESRGERPALSDYIQQYPELANRIRELLPDLVAQGVSRPANVAVTGGYEPAHDKVETPERLGDFRILREVGRGGMGIVYEAEQESLGRRVALKVLPAGALLNAHQRKRFQREARAAARLHHTNIVPVFGVGEHDGLLYYVMQFIRGPGLDQVLTQIRRLRGLDGAAADDAATALQAPPPANEGDDSAASLARSLLMGRPTVRPLTDGPTRTGTADQTASGPRLVQQPEVAAPTSPLGSSSILPEPGRHYWQAVASIGAKVAEALHYAAAQGILHRDIKPANLLLDSSGNVWIADFGLAKAAAGNDEVTQVGEIVGTVRYMAPERFTGQSDIRGDIYSLGLTLYELIAQRPAFAETDQSRLIHLVLHAEPTPPRRLEPQIPRDLETVVLKAMARDPAHRYQTAAALAEDLRRFGEGRPVMARPVGPMERLWRWCKRNPALAGASGLAILALLATITVLLCFVVYQGEAARQLRHEKDQTEAALQQASAQKDRAETALKDAKRQAAVQMLERALGLCEQHQEARGMLWLARSLQEVPEEDGPLKETIRANLSNWATNLHFLEASLAHQGEVTAVAFSPDGQTALTGSRDKTARLWSVTTGEPLGSPLLHQGAVLAVAFSPDGRTVLTASEDKTARLWSTAARQPLGEPLKHQATIHVVAFSPDGKTVLTGSDDKTARLWSAASGQPLGPALQHQGVVRCVAFSPDSRTALTGSDDKQARLWSVATCQPLGQSMHHQGAVYAVAFSPDGRLLLTGSQDHTARLWSVATSQLLKPPLQHQDEVHAAAFSPDSQTVLTGSDDKTARLWSVATGQPLGSPLQHQTWIRAVAYSPDGQTVLTGSEDDTARLWSVATTQPLGPPLLHQKQIRALAFSLDGKKVLTGSNDSTARLWTVGTGLPQECLPHQNWVVAVAFSPDGRSILTGSADNKARLWSAATRQPLVPPLQHQGAVWSVAFSPEGRTALTGSLDKTARLWSSATGEPIGPPMQHEAKVWSVAFSGDGRTVLTDDERGITHVWSVVTGQPQGPPLQHHHANHAVAYSPDGQTVLTLGRHNAAQLLSAATGQPVGPSLQHQGSVRSVAYSPDGRMLLTGSDDNTARLWSAATGKPVGPPLFHQASVLAVAFSADSQRVLTGSGDKTARLWSVATGQPLGPPLMQGPVWAVAFSPDGRTMLTGSEDNTARLWSVQQPLEADPASIDLWLAAVTGLALDENDAVKMLEGSTWRTSREQYLQLKTQLAAPK